MYHEEPFFGPNLFAAGELHRECALGNVWGDSIYHYAGFLLQFTDCCLFERLSVFHRPTGGCPIVLTRERPAGKFEAEEQDTQLCV